MDATRILRNNHGIAIVYLALLLLVMVSFAALAIDVGYMYVTKSQLQNAADAGALAGAIEYKNQYIAALKAGTTVSSTQINQVRSSAEQYAETHTAAAAPVQLSNDTTTNTINSTNDISLGFWSYSTHYYNDVNPNPINAVKVRARRTSDSPAGAVGSFFAKIAGWDLFNIQADAIAGLPSGAGLYIALCEKTCAPACVFPNICDLDPPRVLEKPVPPSFPYENALTWTTLTTSPSSSNIINGLLCSELPYKQVCSKLINTNTGSINSQFQNLESLMYNPAIDGSNKEFDNSGNVVGWWAITPVMALDPADPSKCLLDDDHIVVKYALIRIRVICSSGSVGTSGTPLCEGTAKAPANLCGGGPGKYPNDSIVIDKISCIDCGNQIFMPGLKAQLVE